LIQKEGFIPWYEILCAGVKLVKPKSSTPELPLIIGFDAEWIEEPKEPSDDPDADDPRDPDALPGNLVLSYQYACRFGGHEWSEIVYTKAGARIRFPDLGERELARYPDRVRFADLLGEAISAGTKPGRLRQWPKHVIAAAHWTRADLSAMADFGAIKSEFDGVQKTYVTMKRRYKARTTFGKRSRTFDVTLVDTQLLVPGSSQSLATLGKMYGFEKLDPGRAETRAGEPYIEHMDWLLADDPAHYEAYAIKDAQICALHVEKMLIFARDELGLDLRKPPVTLGSLAVKYLEKRWAHEGIDPGAVNGFKLVKGREFNRNTGKGYLTNKARRYRPRYRLHEKLAEQCFHGGRNECFWYGPTSEMSPDLYAPVMDDWDGERWIGEILFREFDLAAAYATALASLCIPDYDNARTTTDPADFRPDELGFARVRFSFPPETTRFPCLPVIASDERGLVYPLNGEAYVTAPEIVLALQMGAEITILDGVVIPWVEDSPQPFELVIRELSRRRSEHPKGSLQNEMFKQLGNSLYGKLGQGIKGTTSYNTRDDKRIEIGPSQITNPYLAAHVTGLIRALVSELIASVPDRWTVVSVTTDGFVTNAPLSGIRMDGPVASFLTGVRSRLTEEPMTQWRYDGDRGLLEIKYEAARLLPWRTRGVATLTREWDFSVTHVCSSRPRPSSGACPFSDFCPVSCPCPFFCAALAPLCPIPQPAPTTQAVKTGPGPNGPANPKNAPKAKLARGGMREPSGTKDANAWFVRTALTREPRQKYASKEPLPFPEAHRKNADHRFRETERAINFEYDFKRQPVDPFPQFLPLPSLGPDEDPQIVQHLTLGTIPWSTVAEFNAARDLFDQWRHKHGGQLKTKADWRRWEEFQAGTIASQSGVRRGKGGLVGQALRIFRHAYVKAAWGLPGGSYKRAAESLTAASYPTKEQDFKNALRHKSPLPEHAIPADAPGIRELVRALLSIWPEFEWKRLVFDPEPDYLRQTGPVPHPPGPENGGNPGEFQTAV
jgi:hypothetical protein